ncbi:MULTISPECIES: nitroreductase/quinone reductase family protein [unclassified Knoellia]|uniref:nitroreductase/quinone reductase family protein n=1 Tax=Knoellia altitudinis TaxID=3404795 RepID=UPI003620868C
MNPVARRMVGRGAAGDQLVILHFTGRRSGRRYDVPTGYRAIDGSLSVFTSSGWRHNFKMSQVIEVTTHGQRRQMRAELVEDPDTVADTYWRLIDKHGVKWADRHLGIRINTRHAPSRAELKEMVQRSGLSVLLLTPQ